MRQNSRSPREKIIFSMKRFPVLPRAVLGSVGLKGNHSESKGPADNPYHIIPFFCCCCGGRGSLAGDRLPHSYATSEVVLAKNSVLFENLQGRGSIVFAAMFLVLRAVSGRQKVLDQPLFSVQTL